jgi:hypothetical protein
MNFFIKYCYEKVPLHLAIFGTVYCSRSSLWRNNCAAIPPQVYWNRQIASFVYPLRPILRILITLIRKMNQIDCLTKKRVGDSSIGLKKFTENLDKKFFCAFSDSLGYFFKKGHVKQLQSRFLGFQ